MTLYSGFSFTATCPRCEGLLRHLTGATTLLGTESTAVARCDPCRRDWQVVCRLLPVESPGAADRRRYRQRDKERVA